MCKFFTCIFLLLGFLHFGVYMLASTPKNSGSMVPKLFLDYVVFFFLFFLEKSILGWFTLDCQ